MCVIHVVLNWNSQCCKDINFTQIDPYIECSLKSLKSIFTCLEKLPTFLKFYEKQRAKKSPSNLKETEESCLNYNTDYKNLF